MRITINTPRWFDTIYFTIRYAFKSALYIINPPTCSECNSRMITEYGHFEYKKWGISNNSRTKLICNHCIAAAINNGTACHGIFGTDIEDYDTHTTCDRCKEPTSAQKYYSSKDGRIDLRILSPHSWNGSFICKKCAVDILSNANHITGTISAFNGKFLPLTRSGLFIKNNKVLLFRIVKRK